jgi:hypothetical protein
MMLTRRRGCRCSHRGVPANHGERRENQRDHQKEAKEAKAGH